MAVETTNKITPFLWFNDNAGEAADYYVSVFPNAKRTGGMTGPDGKVITAAFELEGLSFTALNGNRNDPFTHAVSFFIKCKDQPEIDYYWNRFLSDGGSEVACGWIKDKFGLSWQVVPENIMELIKPPKAFQAMMGMKKLVIADLEAAAREG
jgi:predicted 3-demethylubiquinone-9 3-methyltransferase (glyoxalase superfamily)